jgi:capsular exopolysaccharide synthesis family protein
MDRISKALERVHHERRPDSELERPVSHAGEAVDIRRVEVSPALLRRNKIVLAEDEGEFGQAYKVLRTRLWHQVRANGWHNIGVTSASPREGKTLTSINLALNLAMMEIGRTVVLVDLDMRHPCIHRYFGIRPEYGVSDFLLSGMPLHKIMIDVGVERLVVVPGSTSFLNSSEILSSKRIVQLLQEIKNYFPARLVIADLPPVLVADDVLVMAPHLNAFLLVIEEAGSGIKDVKKTIELLKDFNLAGAVLNKSAESVPHQYYGY